MSRPGGAGVYIDWCITVQGHGAATSEIRFIQVPGIQVYMSVRFLCSYYGVRKNTDC